MECVIAGSLQSMLASFQQLSQLTTVNFMRDILLGLSRLHSEGIMHRDVKPQNVLVTTSGQCKLTDFGASAMLNALARGDDTAAVEGTPLYLAPEAARGNATFKSDIWSVGIMFLQLITGVVPYQLPSDQDVDVYAFVYQVGSGILKPVFNRGLLPPQTLDFVDNCLEPAEAKRKTANELLALPFFFV
jgi:serine/threonine protein kinase